jgi:ABC-type branched-subunit amino acid transport system substrate-binding protein
MKLSKLLPPSFLLIIMQIFSAEGMQSGQNKSVADNTIKIGLLIQSNQCLAAKEGTELAVRLANEKGGYKGRKFQAVVRSMEGPWGTGSREAVSLIFDDKVFAIIGSHDGRNAHIVEQVSAKSHIPYLSAWSSDPTLSQAFVPWFFNCVPNDLQQASSLIEEIYHRRNLKKAAIVSDNSYDANLAVKSFLKKTKTEGISEPKLYSSENFEKDFNDLATRIKKADAECIILFGQPGFAWDFIRLMRSIKMNQTVYGSLFALGEKELSDPVFAQNGIIVMVSSAFYLKARGKVFMEEFERIYGNKPTEAAAYAFDAANLIIEAIRGAETDRDKIKNELAKIHYEGVTGLIQFDDKGNRMGEAGLIEITNGKPVAVGR